MILGKLTVAMMALLQPALIMNNEKVFGDFKPTTIENKPAEMKQFKNKVVMVVNVASKCGLTTQYEALEKVYLSNKDKNFMIVGFPANNFGNQEPGTNEEIAQFCSSKYSVTFPMMSKISVKGDDIDPIYKWLIASSDRPKEEIEWNFAKFLIDKKGQVRYRFSPRTSPDSKEITEAIQILIKE